MNRTLQFLRPCACAVVLYAGDVCAEPAEATPAAVAFTGMRRALALVAATPRDLTPGESAELAGLLRNTQLHVAVLGACIGPLEVAPEYLRDLIGLGLALSQLTAKSTVQPPDIARLRLIAAELAAKRRWAEHNPAVPTVEIAIDVTIVGSASGVSAREIRCRRAIDRDVETSHPCDRSGGGPERLMLRPGNYELWVRERRDGARDGLVRAVAVDGTELHVRLEAPSL